jgi:hypothetical protein
MNEEEGGGGGGGKEVGGGGRGGGGGISDRSHHCDQTDLRLPESDGPQTNNTAMTEK